VDIQQKNAIILLVMQISLFKKENSPLLNKIIANHKKKIFLVSTDGIFSHQPFFARWSANPSHNTVLLKLALVQFIQL